MGQSSKTKTDRPLRSLRKLLEIKSEYGAESGSQKLEMLKDLEKAVLSNSSKVLDLHEALCFLRTYPDSRGLLLQVEKMLSGFSRRRDLVEHREQLADTGIAGTTISFPFFWFTAKRLAARFPAQLHIDWEYYEEPSRLVDYLSLLLILSDTPAYDEVDFEPREWVDMLRGRDETDAVFLIKRFEHLKVDTPIREFLYEGLNLPLLIQPGKNAPSRTTAKYFPSPVAYQTKPLIRGRPRLPDAIHEPQVSIENVSRQEGQKLIDLARDSMITRSRDLDSFMFADPTAVQLIDSGDGLQFATFCYVPGRRLLMESVYSFLTLKNGVPTGYVLCSSLFQSVEIAYNVFDTYRGEDAAFVYGRVLSMLRTVFNCDTFTVDPFQLGKENREGLESGAWWFYYKLGFRPLDPEVRRVLRGELARMKKNPRHRSSIATLEKLSSQPLHYFLGKPRKDVIGILSIGDIGLRIMETIAERFGSNREEAEEVCSNEAAKLLGLRSRRGFSSNEKLLWKQWGPLIMTLPGVSRWSSAQKQELIQTVRAKAGRHESDYVRRFDSFKRLRSAVLKLAE